jgi:cytosine/adenosine deaminase-related metal-dependent hydrolase
MVRCRASWLLPIAERPIRDGWVAIDAGRVVSYGGADRPGADVEGGRDVDLGSVAILPGLVNAHTHLELSYLRGRVPRDASFVSWIRAVMAARRAYPDPTVAEILDGVVEGIAEAIRCGTAAVGDISNTLATSSALAESALAGVVFYELIGFNTADPTGMVDRACDAIRGVKGSDRVRASLAAHAPYSVAPAVLRAIAEAMDRDGLPTCSVHLSESAEEVEFLLTGEGPWRQLLEDVGAWNPTWVAPGVSPVQYLAEHAFLGSRVMAVHGVQMTAADLARLAAHHTTLVTCPRSNEFTGAGTPPIEQFYRSGVAVAVGTDSLASTPDLNLFSELAAMRALAPAVPAAMLIESATKQGARALGLEVDYGTIEAGKRARLVAVTVPRDVVDVEEYLVSGIEPEQIRWIEESSD